MKNKYRVLVVEDEPKAREQLVGMLGQFEDFSDIFEAGSLKEAQRICESEDLDLAFCDVMLPDGMSLDWIAQRGKIDFELIFITSHQDFATKAFRLAALDYLLKPLDKEEFRTAVLRFLTKKDKKNSQIEQLIHNLKSPKEQTKIALPTLHGYLFVEIRQIVRCESDNTYTNFFLKDGKKLLVSRTLKDVEQLLEDFGFCRVHNSHLINMDYVEEYLKGEGGQVKLSDGTHVDVSRRRKEEFLGQLKKW
ncbi:two component transcriptional regulator, LytTR family [Algoriphagus faecimaris]|uniref:Two component transcriptional regulator, LytTR family n=1 Tax=Algoriphagus faecimaris TaxID=686796 RepID=A0A1G6TIN0_9BACT|nr:LytTR family DNA-binding domain-containing protein [Algoriphagus faecimaris]SDD28948.1 two component transcriptional regulator, LytTR family [Algoriphagus faecimaris]